METGPVVDGFSLAGRLHGLFNNKLRIHPACVSVSLLRVLGDTVKGTSSNAWAVILCLQLLALCHSASQVQDEGTTRLELFKY